MGRSQVLYNRTKGRFRANYNRHNQQNASTAAGGGRGGSGANSSGSDNTTEEDDNNIQARNRKGINDGALNSKGAGRGRGSDRETIRNQRSTFQPRWQNTNRPQQEQQLQSKKQQQQQPQQPQQHSSRRTSTKIDEENILLLDPAPAPIRSVDIYGNNAPSSNNAPESSLHDLVGAIDLQCMAATLSSMSVASRLHMPLHVADALEQQYSCLLQTAPTADAIASSHSNITRSSLIRNNAHDEDEDQDEASTIHSLSAPSPSSTHSFVESPSYKKSVTIQEYRAPMTPSSTSTVFGVQESRHYSSSTTNAVKGTAQGSPSSRSLEARNSIMSDGPISPTSTAIGIRGSTNGDATTIGSSSVPNNTSFSVDTRARAKVHEDGNVEVENRPATIISNLGALRIDEDDDEEQDTDVTPTTSNNSQQIMQVPDHHVSAYGNESESESDDEDEDEDGDPTIMSSTDDTERLLLVDSSTNSTANTNIPSAATDETVVLPRPTDELDMWLEEAMTTQDEDDEPPKRPPPPTTAQPNHRNIPSNELAKLKAMNSIMALDGSSSMDTPPVHVSPKRKKKTKKTKPKPKPKPNIQSQDSATIDCWTIDSRGKLFEEESDETDDVELQPTKRLQNILPPLQETVGGGEDLDDWLESVIS